MSRCAEEFAGASLGDARREQRLERIVGSLETDPAAGFPRLLGSDAELEGFYRFINNESFGAEDVVAPHLSATYDRASKHRCVLAVHDTTAVEYSTPRDGLGVTSTKAPGFMAHVALMLSEDGLPLGVGYVETLTRTGQKWRKRKKQGQRGHVHLEDETRESLRWLRGVEAIETARSDRFGVVHITDAEGDFFELLDALRSTRFVIRAGQLDRTVLVKGSPSALQQAVATVPVRVKREIALSGRAHKPRSKALNSRRRHPERSERVARVAIGSLRLGIPPTRYGKSRGAPLEANVVRVWEPSPPTGEPAVEWVLVTSEDVSSPRALERVVDLYRRRWVIEEYFKALKSGCAIEKRQVESYEALRKVFALFVPIAYRLLLLRGLDRLDGDQPATAIFSAAELAILERAPSNRGLPPPVTVHQALLHVARLGGHIKNNGPPGWQTLAWGYQRLLTLRLGWEMRSDQS
jgi:hypothetical protein